MERNDILGDPPSSPGELPEGSAPTDELLTYFFPQPSRAQRMRNGLRKVLEVFLGSILLGLVLVMLYQTWKLADSRWCGWRLQRVNHEHFSRIELKEDLDVLYSALLEHHPRPLEHISKDELDQTFASAGKAVATGATREEFLRIVAPVVARIGCGHTAIRPPQGWISLLARGGRVLPLGIQFIDGRAFVVEYYGSGLDLPLGSEILAINDHPIEGIRDHLIACLSADGPGKEHAWFQLSDFFFFAYAKFLGLPKAFHLRYRPPDMQEIQHIEIDPRPVIRVAETQWKIHPERNPLQSIFPFHGEIFAETRSAYMWVPTFDIGQARGYREVLRQFFAQLHEDQIQSLVIDVRGNSGGPSVIAVALLQYLIDEPFPFLMQPEKPEDLALPVFKHYAKHIKSHREKAFVGELIILTNGGSFSTTGHFCAALAANRAVTFIGEPPGGGFRCQDNGRFVELPNTGLRLRVATTTFEVVSPNDQCPHAIEFTLQIAPTVHDLVSGRDPVLEEMSGRFGVDFEAAARRLRGQVMEIPVDTQQEAGE